MPNAIEVGTRVSFHGHFATVVYSTPGHSVRNYPCPSYVLIQYDVAKDGWKYADDPDLVPREAPHLFGQEGFYWVAPHRLGTVDIYNDVYDVEM